MYWQNQLNTSLDLYANKFHIAYAFSFPAYVLSVVCVSLCMLHYTQNVGNVNSSIAQKSPADFMQIDETKIPASYDSQPGNTISICSS